MTRRPVIKASNQKSIPNLPQHDLQEPFASLQAAGYEEQIDLYQDIRDVESPEKISSIIDQLTDMALDDSYYLYSTVDTQDDVDPRCFAPLQAVRALCYFAGEVARVLPRLIPLFETDDSALREELPLLFSCIGPEATETLVSITIDPVADIYRRDGAAESLVEMTNVFPELKSVVQGTLEIALSACSDPELAAYFIVDLMDLGAEESIEFIVRAFNEARVDLDIITIAEVYEHFSELEDRAVFGTSKSGRMDEFAPDDEFDEDDDEQTPYVAPEKIGRNDPCPCGSGKKYKKCCGDATA